LLTKTETEISAATTIIEHVLSTTI